VAVQITGDIPIHGRAMSYVTRTGSAFCRARSTSCQMAEMLNAISQKKI